MGHRTSTWIGLLCAAVVGVCATLYVWNIPDQNPESTPAVPAGTPEPKAQRLKPPPEQEGLARAATEPFTEAEAIHSVDGRLRATLVVKYGDNVIRGSRVHLRSSNRRSVGPTLRATPGNASRFREARRP